MAQLGRNADGEGLEPGRVPDCDLALVLDPSGLVLDPSGLVLDPAGTAEAPEVLVVATAARLLPVGHGSSVPPADARP